VNQSDSAPKRRRPDQRVERTRKAILEGAATIMLEQGVSGFTVDEVVSRTGIALSTVYRHWRTRDDLLSATIVYSGEPQVIPDTGSAANDVSELLALRRRHIAEHWDVNLQSLSGIIDAGRRNPKLLMAVTQVLDRVLAVLQTILKRGQERGEIRKDLDLKVAADILLGAFIVRNGYRGETTTDADTDNITATIIKGIGAREL